MSDIQSLKPSSVWKHFHAITQVPRPSGHMDAIRAFLLDFGKGLGLETYADSVGNVIIRKPATPGMECRKGIILQAHMDMVPQKNNDVVHDFERDPISTYIDGDWVRAKGTTLGADNGMGMAAIMAVLEDDTLRHGPIEALITMDEETGMDGAFGLKAGELKGEILLNLDSEDEGQLFIGCAGGVDVNVSGSYKEGNADLGKETVVTLSLRGLRGGHSGMEIDKGRANANKMMVRFLRDEASVIGARIVRMEGGNMRNAIPREAFAVVSIPNEDVRLLFDAASKYEKVLKAEFGATEDALSFTAAVTEMPKTSQKFHLDLPFNGSIDIEIGKGLPVMKKKDQRAVLDALYACHDGVLRYIPTIPGTVETSSNMSIVKIEDGRFEAQFLVRSSSESMKTYLANTIEACFELVDATVEMSGAYSGWQPDVDSPILKSMKEVYKSLFGQEPAVEVVHAGLECGIIGAAMPGLDMISFGPTLRSPHSPDERVYVPSVEKFYKFLVASLENAPLK